MVSDQEIANGVASLLRQSDPNAFTTFNSVVQHLETKLGLDLSHKSGFIRNQIEFLIRSSHAHQTSSPHPHPHPHPHPPPPPPPVPPVPVHVHVSSKDHFALHQQHQHPQFQHQIPSHFALQHQHQLQHQQQYQRHHEELNFQCPLPPPPPQAQHQQQQQQQQQLQIPHPQQQQQQQQHSRAHPKPKKGVTKDGAIVKRRGGPGGLTKVCGVSPELQAIVGEPTMPRTQIVKQLWAYIRKNNLQDPSNKRKIICNDELRLVFEVDSTDMFKMNKLLAKHIIALEPSKEPTKKKKVKAEAESASETQSTTTEVDPALVIISDALAKFFGTGEREMLQTEALRRVWEYIQVNHLEDPLNSTVIICDEKLQELFGCESISALGVSEMVGHHFFKRS